MDKAVRIFIDDMRENPDGTVLCTSLDEFSLLLDGINPQSIEHVDFDYYLQNETGEECILHLYQYCSTNQITLPKAIFHSSSSAANAHMSELYTRLDKALKATK